MPTIYKAKQKSQLKRSRADNIPIDVIQRALDEIKTKTKSIRQASKDYNIPKSTLFGYVKANKIPGSQMYRSKFITRQLFTDTEEKALADYLITSANMHYGLIRQKNLPIISPWLIIKMYLKIGTRINEQPKIGLEDFFTDKTIYQLGNQN
jgi:hypothetical protein